MFAMSGTTEYPAMAAGEQCTARAQRMHPGSARNFAHTMCGMWATASATASILLFQTGVSASVSLFVLLITLGTFLLVSLLCLSGLTGLVISRVGLVKGLSPGTNAGD
jgi:hypothetical protein